MSNITRWVVNYTEPLPTYIDGRVALLGDSVSLLHLSERWPSILAHERLRHTPW